MFRLWDQEHWWFLIKCSAIVELKKLMHPSKFNLILIVIFWYYRFTAIYIFLLLHFFVINCVLFMNGLFFIYVYIYYCFNYNFSYSLTPTLLTSKILLVIIIIIKTRSSSSSSKIFILWFIGLSWIKEPWYQANKTRWSNYYPKISITTNRKCKPKPLTIIIFALNIT